MRKNFLDNIRFVAILMLFPYHTFMMYNTWGENFYIQGTPNYFMSGFIQSVSPWLMPLMFTIAGIAARYSLQKRTKKEFIKERMISLFIPLIAGIILLCPMMTFFAEKFHNGYTGNYFEQYVLFFTKTDDFSGGRGGFTPGHLWFLLFLFVISILVLPIILIVEKSKKKIPFEKFPLITIVFLFIFIAVASYVPSIGGKNLVEYFILFLLGHYVLSKNEVLDRLEKYKWLLFGGFILMMVFNLLFIYKWDCASGALFDIFLRLFGWIGILAILGMAKRYFNQRSKFTEYFSKSSYPIYILHQPILIMVAYYIFMLTDIIATQTISVILISFVLTIGCYEIFKRVPYIRLLFGIRVKKKTNVIT